MSELRKTKPLKVWTSALILLFAFAASAVSAQSDTAAQNAAYVGKVIMATGTVRAEDNSGVSRQLQRHSEIFIGDRLITAANSSAQLRMVDAAIVSLRENSEFEILTYAYNQDPANDRSSVRLINGGFRTITGLMGTHNRDSYEAIIMEFGVIGIRGTDYEAVISQNGQLLLGVWDGGITFSNAAGALDLGLNASYDYGRVLGINSAPEGLVQQPNGIGDIVIADDDGVAQADLNVGTGPATVAAAANSRPSVLDVIAGALGTTTTFTDANSIAALDLTSAVFNPNEFRGDGSLGCADGAAASVCQPLALLSSASATTNSGVARSNEGAANGGLATNVDVVIGGATNVGAVTASGSANTGNNAGVDIVAGGTAGSNGTADVVASGTISSSNGTVEVIASGTASSSNGTVEVITSGTASSSNGTVEVIASGTVEVIASGDNDTTVDASAGGDSGAVDVAVNASGTTGSTTTGSTTTGTGGGSGTIGVSVNAGVNNDGVTANADGSIAGNNINADGTVSNPVPTNSIAGSTTDANATGAASSDGTTIDTSVATDVTAGTTTAGTSIIGTVVETATTVVGGIAGSGTTVPGILALSRPQSSIEEYNVSWAKWDEPVDQNWVMVANINDELVRISTGDYFADVAATPIANLKGSHSFATGIASSFFGRGSAGEINSLVARLDVDFNNGAITNGSLRLQVSNQDWLVKFDGAVNAGQVELNASEGRVIDSMNGTSNAVKANLGGAFTGNNAEVFVGGFDLSEVNKPLNFVGGLYTIER